MSVRQRKVRSRDSYEISVSG